MFVGATIPLEMIAQNYILEVTPVERHATSLGVANLVLIASSVTPLVVGPLIDAYGPVLIFKGLAVVMLAAVYLCARLGEPRFDAQPGHHPPPSPPLA